MQFVDLKAQYRILKTEIDAGIARVLDHGRFINGPEVGELEEKIARAEKDRLRPRWIFVRAGAGPLNRSLRRVRGGRAVDRTRSSTGQRCSSGRSRRLRGRKRIDACRRPGLTRTYHRCH